MERSIWIDKDNSSMAFGQSLIDFGDGHTSDFSSIFEADARLALVRK